MMLFETTPAAHVAETIAAVFKAAEDASTKACLSTLTIISIGRLVANELHFTRLGRKAEKDVNAMEKSMEKGLHIVAKPTAEAHGRRKVHR